MIVTENPETRLLALFKNLGTLPIMRAPDNIELSMPQVALLNLVARRPGCGVLDIAKEMNLAPPTISVGIRRLAKAGWVERRYDPRDRRARPLFLTPKGQTLMDQVQEHRFRMLHFFLSGLAPDEQSQLLSLLEKAVAAMEAGLENDI